MPRTASTAPTSVRVIGACKFTTWAALSTLGILQWRDVIGWLTPVWVVLILVLGLVLSLVEWAILDEHRPPRNARRDDSSGE